MKRNNKYEYAIGKQINEDNGRIYDVAGFRLPSVTSILSRTKDQGFLKQWREKVVELGLAPIDEYYGSEVTMYYPGLYAGQTDLVCIHDGKDAIVDFKQANRPKREEWIDDYKLQIAAYAMAHDYVYNSTIEKGVIMVCTPDLYYQEFIVEGVELRNWKHKFLKRLNMYHDLIFDEKEQAKIKMKAEDFNER